MPVQHTILVVEDSPVQAIVLRRFLTQSGFLVVIAKDGVEALEALKKQVVSLIISDINMPRMNGFELCRTIKSDPNLWNIPVILSTALSTPNDLIVGIEVGADNYIPHPWNNEQLLATVDELIKSPLKSHLGGEIEEVVLRGQTFKVSTSRQYILNFLLSTYENVHTQNKELSQLKNEIQKAYKRLEDAQKEEEQILHQIFPEVVAQELLAYGSVSPKRYESATVMFVDFVGFTKSSHDMTPESLVAALAAYFDTFDEIIGRNTLERIKTMGDGYMAVGGVPEPNPDHAINCVKASLEILNFMKNSTEEMKNKFQVSWGMRIGIHSGELVAGVIGKKRPAYDVWGGTVNMASRMESHSELNRINISAATYELVKEYCITESRGQVPVKNKEGLERYVDMYYVNRLR